MGPEIPESFLNVFFKLREALLYLLQSLYLAADTSALKSFEVSLHLNFVDLEIAGRLIVVSIPIRRVEIDQPRNFFGMPASHRAQLLSGNGVPGQHRTIEPERIDHRQHIVPEPVGCVP